MFYTRKNVDKDITIFHLLTHTSGLYYDFSSKYISVYRKYIKGAKHDIKTLEDFSNQASKLPLLFEPGSDFNYGINTDILGRIIEVVSGQNLELFLQTEIFMPLEMNSTTFNLDNSLSCDAHQLHGDQCIYYIMNDVGNIHTETGADPIGVEILISLLSEPASTRHTVNDLLSRLAKTQPAEPPPITIKSCVFIITIMLSKRIGFNQKKLL